MTIGRGRMGVPTSSNMPMRLSPTSRAAGRKPGRPPGALSPLRASLAMANDGCEEGGRSGPESEVGVDEAAWRWERWERCVARASYRIMVVLV